MGALEQVNGKSRSGNAGPESAGEAASSTGADKQSALNAADILNDPKAFAETFARSAESREKDPDQFNKSLSQLKDKLNSKEISDDDKIDLLQKLVVNPANKGSYALDVAANGNRMLKDVDVVTSDGRHDLLDTFEGQSVDKLQSVVDTVYQAMNLSLDKALVENPARANTIYEGKLQSIGGGPDAFEAALVEPEIAESFKSELERAVKSMPEEMKIATREFAGLVTGGRSTEPPPELSKIVAEMSKRDVSPVNEKASMLGLLISSNASFALSKEQQAERKVFSAELAKNPNKWTEEYEKHVSVVKKSLGTQE